MTPSSLDLHPLAYCAPPPDQPLADWCESHLVLGTRQPTAYPGPLRLDRTPYLRGIMDAMDDPHTHLCVVEAAAQTGKTTVAYGWMIHGIATDPAASLIVYPSEDMARSNSANRIQPLVEDSPSLAYLVPRNRRDDWQLLNYRVGGCTVNLSGANSPAQLASRPIRRLLLDEADKFPTATKGEADAVSLALQRCKSFWNWQAMMVSTPTTPTGAIHQYFLRGDMREYDARCPRCDEFVRVRWSVVKWSAPDCSDAAIVCPVCGERWTEHDRRVAISRGRWRQSRTEGDADPGVVSFHLSGLLAMWCDLPALARKFVRGKRDPSVMLDFTNSDLAEPFVRADAAVTAPRLREREGDYDLDEDAHALRWPADDDTIVLGGCDVQKDYFVLVFRQFRKSDGASAQVWRGMPKTWAEIDKLMDAYHVYGVCMDCRYRSSEIYEQSLRISGIWPTAGVASWRVPHVFEMQTRSIDEGRRGGGGRQVDIIVASSNLLLDMLADRVDGRDDAPAWEIPRGACADKDYVSQMTAMYRSNGAWINPSRRPEHYMDAEKLTLMAAYYIGIRPVEEIPEENEDEKENEPD